MAFKCFLSHTDEEMEEWTGKIIYLKQYKSHYEVKIESRSSIVVLVGKTSAGGFACMPDFEAGCHLTNLKDKFWNTEKLVRVLGEVDGVTVGQALYQLSDQICL